MIFRIVTPFRILCGMPLSSIIQAVRAPFRGWLRVAQGGAEVEGCARDVIIYA